MPNNLIVGQSGGCTAVLNATLAGVIDEALQQPAVDGIYGMLNGVQGLIEGAVVDLRSEAPETLASLRTTPSAALGSCRFKPDDEQLELVLHKLGLNPFVLANTGGGGQTIIEALEKETGPRPGRARFGIVLMTPDDVGYAKRDGPAKAEPRARQNVVMEMGMLVSAIGRTNVAILKKGHLEVPSNVDGIIYLAFNDHVKETVPKLVERLREAGFDLDQRAISEAMM